MAITRAKQSSLRTGVTKYDNLRAGLPFTPTIGTATDGGTGSTVSVAFTANNTAGLTYTALSSPGSLTGTSTTSPITVSGLSSGTAYTFQVNAANSAGTSPYSAASNSVTPVTPSSYESIATVTATGGEVSLTFSSIPGTYSSLQIRGIARANDAGTGATDMSIRFNSDSGSNYAYHILQGTGSTVSASSGATQTLMYTFRNVVGGGAGSGIFGGVLLDVHDYASTSKYKTLRAFAGSDRNTTDTTYRVQLSSGLWQSSSAVTSVTLGCGDGFAAGTTFALYGIK
jgi:hypothetical protein